MNQKIFIIEDDSNLSSALTAKFSLLGFKVTIFIDNEILNITNKIKIHQPAYLIMNLILPSFSGETLLSAIKADEQICKIPVFIFSHGTKTDLKDRAVRLGADQFFDRDKFSIDEFVERVGKIILNQAKLKIKKSK